jgi:hypothetical protein
MIKQIYFTEKQYLGLNFFSIILRTVMAVFCFVIYYWSENPKPVYTDIGNFRIGSYPAKEIPRSGEIFFLLGNAILILSIILIFVKHIIISVTENYIIIKRLWSNTMIKIDIKTINYVKKHEVEHVYFQRPVFNLLKKNTIRFYTNGDEAIELVDKDNTRYFIGTNKAGEFSDAILKIINKQASNPEKTTN